MKQKPSEDSIWWSPQPPNKPVSPEIFDKIFEKVKKYMNGKEGLYCFDGYCGANPKSAKKVRFVTEYAWQHHFVTNMFVRPSINELSTFKPDFTTINCSKGLVNDQWKEMGLNSEAFGGFNIEKKVAVILGAKYGGEMKKGVFSLMNYWLPKEGILSMHCSANKGKDGNTAVFFGLSGTGKTTLSADPKRFLIGDDEHGWDDEGIFNFEGGCYAKTINLSKEKEPDIYAAIKKDALLENVWIDKKGVPDYFNKEKTENGRVSYPLYHISNYDKEAKGPHPTAMIFLTCDAYGVLPPVARLTPEQAMYHFLTGYTAKVAGTERGIKEPTSTFSPCFGAAFMLLHPVEYAKLLGQKLAKHGTKAYLVNTGWASGAYPQGKRMDIPITRAAIDGILDGSLDKQEWEKFDIFNVDIPKHIEGVDTKFLNPRNAWSDKKAYDVMRVKLAQKFNENFKKYVVPNLPDYTKYGPIV